MLVIWRLIQNDTHMRWCIANNLIPVLLGIIFWNQLPNEMIAYQTTSASFTGTQEKLSAVFAVPCLYAVILYVFIKLVLRFAKSRPLGIIYPLIFMVLSIYFLYIEIVPLITELRWMIIVPAIVFFLLNIFAEVHRIKSNK